MKRRFNLTWRVVTALLLVLALVPALAVGAVSAAGSCESIAPYLISISWIDNGAPPNGYIDAGDQLIFYFSEGMDISALNDMPSINARLNSTSGGAGGGNDYGSSGAAFAWSNGDTTLTVTLGTDCRNIDLAGKTVDPSPEVKDKAGNADATPGNGPAIPVSADTTDTYAPRLLSVTWQDSDQDGTYSTGDILSLQFSESISDSMGNPPVLITNSNVETYLVIQGAATTDCATGGAISWLAGATILQITLGATPTIIGGETITPAFTDWHGNACVSPSPVPTIPLPPNTAGPQLMDVVWYDASNIGTLGAGDWLIFRFNETLDDTGVSAATIPTFFTVANGGANPWGDGVAPGQPAAWGKDTAGSMWKVRLGTGTTVQTTPIATQFTPTGLLIDQNGKLCTGSATISSTVKTMSDLLTNEKETTKPYLRSICWWDIGGGASNGIYDQADQLFFYWSETVDPGTLPDTRYYANFLLNSAAEPGSQDYGNGGIPTWLPSGLGEEWMLLGGATQTHTMYRVELLNNEYINGGETVTPASSIKDPAGNTVNTTAARIPYASDTTSPTLLSIGWIDDGNVPGPPIISVPNDGIINEGDHIVFRFSEAMLIASFPVAALSLDSNIVVTGNNPVESWGTGAMATAAWAFGDGGGLYGCQLTVALGTGETIDGGEITNPAGFITDAKGNADNTPTPAGVPVPLPPDKTCPTLQSIVWQDINGNLMIDQYDHLLFCFSEAMDSTTITGGPGNVGTQLESNAPGTGADYGTSPTVIWNTPVNTQCTVILDTLETIVGGEWVNPNSVMPGGVTDAIGNPDATYGAGVQIASVPGTPPTIVRSPSTLTFTASVNGSNPADQMVTISNSGQQTLNWAASKTAAWLTINPTSDTNSGTVTCSVNTSGLNISTYTDTITITATGATNTPQTVAVTLTITVPATPTPTATPATNASPTPTATANATATPTATPVTTPVVTATPTPTPGVSTASASIGTDGGVVEIVGKVKVTFPAGAFDTATTVTITSGTCTHDNTDAFKVGGTCFSVTPSGALGEPAEICVQLSSYDLNIVDDDTSKLTLGYWADSKWNEATDVTVTGNEICGQTTHLSDWAVLGSTGEGWLWWYWALIGGGAFIVVLAIILLLVLPKRGKGEEIPSEELYGEEEEEF